MRCGESRDYERARSHLEAIEKFIEVERARDMSLISIEIKIADTNHVLSERTEIATEIAGKVREDLPRLISAIRIKAQDDLRAAGEALRATIDSDLKSNMMRD